MTDTPDTDANQIFLGFNPDEGDYFVPAEIARKLEQQRNEAVNNYETAVLREHRMQEQRDRVAVALDVCLREMLDVIYACNEQVEDVNDTFHQAIKLGQNTLDNVKGRSDELIELKETAERYRLDANAMMMQRDRLEMIACELIAMIRMNVACGKFAECSFEQINEHLKPWIERIQSVKGTQIE